MAGLKRAPFTGVVKFLGTNSSRADDLTSASIERSALTYAGMPGEDHGGLNRKACSRLRNVHPQGVDLKNMRQLTVLSVEEMKETAASMGIEDGLDPCWVGANIVLEGVPHLTLLPPGTRLQLPDGGTIVVDMENGPCKYPGEIIEAQHPGKGMSYPQAAYGKRGFTAFVEREGEIALGDEVAVFYPRQDLHPLQREDA